MTKEQEECYKNQIQQLKEEKQQVIDICKNAIAKALSKPYDCDIADYGQSQDMGKFCLAEEILNLYNKGVIK